METTQRRTVKSFKEHFKPNRYTYHNIDDDSAERLQRLYKYLLAHEDKNISFAGVIEAEKWINKKNELDFLRRFKVAEIISTNIIH